MAIAITVKEAYLKAFQADTISAFGGVLATNATIDLSAAEEINKLFFEILIAPAYLIVFKEGNTTMLPINECRVVCQMLTQAVLIFSSPFYRALK